MKLCGILEGWKAVCKGRKVMKKLPNLEAAWNGKCSWNPDPIHSCCYKLRNQPCFTTAVVVALYPSMRLERGMAALLWFMDNHTREQLNALQMCPCISRWNNRAGLGLIWKASGCTGSSSGSAKMPWSSWISRPRHLRGANLKPGRDSDLLEAQVPSLFLPFRKPSNAPSMLDIPSKDGY